MFKNLLAGLVFLFSLGAIANPIPSDTLTLGRKSAGDKTIVFEKGAGAANPKIKFNNSTSKIQFSHNGTVFQDIGSGSGGGGSFPNFILNGDAEAATQNWTASAGAFTTTSAAANLYAGTASFSWTPAAASDTLTSDAIAVTSGGGLAGANVAAQCTVKTSSALHKFQVLDGANVLNEYTIPAGTAFSTRALNFIGPSGGSLTVRFLAGDTGAVYFDNCILSDARAINLGTIANATFLGSISWAPTADCFWQTASETLAAFSADTDCDDNTITYHGLAIADVSTPGQLPQIRLSKIPGPGRVVLKAVGSFAVDRQNFIAGGHYSFFDGSSTSLLNKIRINTGNTSSAQTVIPKIDGEFSYTSGLSAKTFSILGFTESSTNSGTIYIDARTSGLTISAYFYPEADTQVFNPSTSYQGGSVTWYNVENCDFENSTTVGVMSDVDCGNPTRKTGAAGNPTTANNLETTFTNLPAGSYQVTASGAFRSSYATSNTTCVFEIYDGSTVIASAAASATSSSVVEGIGSITGEVHYSSLQPSRVFQVRSTRTGGGGNCTAAATPPKALSIIVTPKTQSLPAPILVGLKDTQYNLTVTGTNWTTTRAVGVPYQTEDGVWRLKFNINGTMSSPNYFFSGTIAGVSFPVNQALSASVVETGVLDRVVTYAKTFTTTTWQVATSPGNNFNSIVISGDVELSGKPSFVP